MAFNSKGALAGGASGAAAGSAAGPVGAAIGAIGGAAIGAFSSNSSSYKNYKYAKKLQQQAAALNYEYAQKSALNSPSWYREGLESAGYNPMLAVQNSTSGANSSWTSAGGSSGFDMSQGISSGVANAQSFQRLKNETEATESVNDKNYAEADEAKARKMEVLARLPFVSNRQKAELSKMTAETAEIENRIHLANEALKLQQTGMDINVKSYQLEKEVQDIMRDKEDRYKHWGTKHPYLRNIDETVSRYLGKSPISFSKRVK